MRSPGSCVTRTPPQVVIGYDMRDSSPALAEAFAEGVAAQGLDVVRIGLASTDQLYFASGLLDCPGAMFTASHNPAAYNGIKLCRAGAKPVGKDTGLTAISEEVIAGVPVHDGPRGSMSDRDVLADYGEFLRSLVSLAELRPLKVAVDAGNGMAGHTTPAVLGSIPSITLAPLFFELDGTFPNHEANPLDPANLVDLQAYVLETGADIGLAFDGDADRCFVVDELGQPVSPSAVTALVAARELGREIGATVIYNLITSRAVPELVAERGGHRRALARRALLHQGADGRHRRDLRRRAFGALLLPRLLGRRLRHAGGPACAGGTRRAESTVVRPDGRLPAV